MSYDPEKGIGTYTEGETHAELKARFEPDPSYHEVKCRGYVADVMRDGKIYEIQTRGFYMMKDKLTSFLEEYDVTVVYPIIREKTLIWVDPLTGETSKPRKSSKHGRPSDLLGELYGVADFLSDKKFHIRVVLCDSVEYRLLDGWSRDRKKGSTRQKLLPLVFAEEYAFDRPEDYRTLVPSSLPDPFTRKELSKALRLTGRGLYSAQRVLLRLGFIEEAGKKGNAILYRVVPG